MVTTAVAQLPPEARSEDRAAVTDNAIIVLDGASAFAPGVPPPGAYTDSLSRRLRDQLAANPTADLRAVLRIALAETAAALSLEPGRSPSATVSIARATAGGVDVLMLGDSPVVVGNGDGWSVFTDTRIEDLRLSERVAYRRRLAKGSGYDSEHRRLLRQLQASQHGRRNLPGGYWIAEADPAAADHAITAWRPLAAVRWCVACSDGAFGPIVHLGLDDWSAIAAYDGDQLHELLERCQVWEATIDPDGEDLPRSKRHDDKTIAVLRLD